MIAKYDGAIRYYEGGTNEWIDCIVIPYVSSDCDYLKAVLEEIMKEWHNSDTSETYGEFIQNELYKRDYYDYDIFFSVDIEEAF